MELEKIKELMKHEFEGKSQIQKTLSTLSTFEGKDLKTLTPEEVVSLISVLDRETTELNKVLNKVQVQKEVEERSLKQKFEDLKREFGVDTEEAFKEKISELEVKLQGDLDRLSTLKKELAPNVG